MTKDTYPSDPSGVVIDNFVQFGEVDHFKKMLDRGAIKTIVMMYANEDDKEYPTPPEEPLRELLSMIIRHILAMERMLVPALDVRRAVQYTRDHAITYRLDTDPPNSDVAEIIAYIESVKDLAVLNDAVKP